jgi:hypothetical protein
MIRLSASSELQFRNKLILATLDLLQKYYSKHYYHSCTRLRIQGGEAQIFAQIIDAHGLKIQGRGYLMFLPKFLGGVKAFRKNCLGGPPILGFIAFLLTSFSKICPGGGAVSYPPPTPCVHLWPKSIKSWLFGQNVKRVNHFGFYCQSHPTACVHLWLLKVRTREKSIFSNMMSAILFCLLVL